RAWVARLVRAEDAKYGILAREIHDAYVPTLMGTAMQWQGRAPAEMISAIQKVASDLRSLSHSLHPNSIDSIGLVGALEDLVSPWKEAPSLSKCTLTVVGQCRMSPECALACYRIAQAALSNARIHA